MNEPKTNNNSVWFLDKKLLPVDSALWSFTTMGTLYCCNIAQHNMFKVSKTITITKRENEEQEYHIAAPLCCTWVKDSVKADIKKIEIVQEGRLN